MLHQGQGLRAGFLGLDVIACGTSPEQGLVSQVAMELAFLASDGTTSVACAGLFRHLSLLSTMRRHMTTALLRALA